MGEIMYDNKATKIFDRMMKDNIIPRTGQFQITEEILDASYQAGRDVLKRTHKKRTPSDKKFHRKQPGSICFI